MTFPENGILKQDGAITPGTTVSGTVSGDVNPESDSVTLLAGTWNAADLADDAITPLDPRVLRGVRPAEGSFVIDDVPQGKYTLMLLRRERPRSMRAGSALTTTNIEVGTHPVEGIILEVTALADDHAPES